MCKFLSRYFKSTAQVFHFAVVYDFFTIEFRNCAETFCTRIRYVNSQSFKYGPIGMAELLGRRGSHATGGQCARSALYVRASELGYWRTDDAGRRGRDIVDEGHVR